MPSMFSDQATVQPPPPRLTFLPGFTFRNRLVLFALVAVLLSLAVPQARAQMTIDTKTSQELQIKTGTAELNVEIRVHNGDDADRQIVVGERLYKSGEQTSIALTSARGDRTTDHLLPKGADARYVLTATLAEPGAYVAAVDVLSDDGKQTLRSIKLNVTREGQPVPSGLMVAPAPLTVTWPSSLFSPSETLILLRNDGNRPINIGAPKLLSFGSSGGATDSSGADSSGITLDGRDCAEPLLRPGASCAVKVTLDKPRWPGSYSLTVGVGGAAGGWSQQTLTISAGLSIIIAFIVAALGLLVGVLLDEWRKRGRPLVDSLIRLQTLKDNLDKPPLGPQPKPELKVATEQLRLEVARWRDRIGEAPPDDATLATLQARYERLIQASLLIDANAKIDSFGRQVLQPRVDALLGLLTEPQLSETTASNLNTLVGVVGNDMQSWQQGEQLRERARTALMTLNGLESPQQIGTEIAAVAEPIKDADAALRSPLPSGLAAPDLAETIAKRSRGLTDAIGAANGKTAPLIEKAKQLLRARAASLPQDRQGGFTTEVNALASGGDLAKTLADLARLWNEAFATGPGLTETPATANTPATSPGATVDDIHIDFLGRWSTLTTQQMRARRADYEWWWNAGVIALFALGLAVASITPTWGGLADLSKLFLSGVGARLALAALTNK